jgi:hypothetical protein
MKTISTRKWFLKIIILLTLLMTYSCEKGERGPEKIDTGIPVYCKVVTNYKINNDLTFSIDSISDYRCPRDLECFWSGDVDLLFNINHYELHIDTLIHAITRRNNPFVLAGYKWEVLEVNPWLSEHQNIISKDYRIKILLQKDYIFIPM